MRFSHTISQVVSSIVTMVVIAGFLSYPTQGYALSCAPRKVKFIAICQEGQCENGFVIERERTGEPCITRPVVHEQIDDLTAKEAFSKLSVYFTQKIASGIYELAIHQDSSCLRTIGSWDVIKELDFCKTTMEVVKYSDSTDKNALERYKNEWRIKEQESLRAVTVEKWKGVVTVIVIDLFVIIWPLLFLWVFPLLRKHILLLLLPAIAIQVYTATTMHWRYMWSYPLLQDVASISSILLYITALVYTLYVIGSFIYRKLRRKTITTSN